MAFDFPSSPTVGQKYTASGVTYAWNGYAWDPSTSALSVVGFRATKGGTAQTNVATGLGTVFTKIIFPTEDYDLGSYYDAPNSRWTPPAGLVHIDVALHATNTVPVTQFYVYVYKNGVALERGLGTSGVATSGTQVSVDDVANGTDFYEVYVTHNAGANITIDGTSAFTFFNGHPVTATQGPPGVAGAPGAPGAAGADGAPGIPGPAGEFSTGDAKITLKTVADSGWVMMNDGTIGDATSGATTRADADCLALFTLLWTNISNALAPVSGGRGASALADWNAHKTIALTKQLGRSISVAGTGAGLSFRPLGGYLGEETHTQSQSELAQHTHGASTTSPYSIWNSYMAVDGGVTYYANQQGGSSSSVTINLQGSSSPFNVMQPTSFWNVMIKL
jgi:hypothetical protein